MKNETSMANTFDTQEHDYLGTPKGWNNGSPGFQPGVKKKSQTRFGAIFGAQHPKIVTKQDAHNQCITKL